MLIAKYRIIFKRARQFQLVNRTSHKLCSCEQLLKSVANILSDNNIT